LLGAIALALLYAFVLLFFPLPQIGETTSFIRTSGRSLPIVAWCGIATLLVLNPLTGQNAMVLRRSRGVYAGIWMVALAVVALVTWFSAHCSNEVAQSVTYYQSHPVYIITGHANCMDGIREIDTLLAVVLPCLLCIGAFFLIRDRAIRRESPTGRSGENAS
jgi:hypothetical protein